MAHCQQLDRDKVKADVYPLGAIENDKRTLRRLTAGFFLSGTILYKRSADLTLLRYVEGQKAKGIMEQVHEGTFGTHTNGHTLARKILRAEPKASNGHRLILVAINYFTKWEEAASYASVTKSILVKFIKKDIIC
ncbi:hypothetical protein CR513_54047, partial [Mucuna pruriens]